MPNSDYGCIELPCGEMVDDVNAIFTFDHIRVSPRIEDGDVDIVLL